MFKNITRLVWILSLVSMFADIASEILYPIIPVYLQNIGFSIFLIGVLEGLAEATAGLSKGYFGNWSDRVGKRMPFVRVGYLLSALSKPMMAVFIYPIWIFFSRTIDRLGKGFRTAPRDALLSGEATLKTKGQVFSFHRGWDTLGAVFGPALALLFLYFYPGQLRWLFYIAFVPGIISVGITYFIKEKPLPTKKQISSPGFFSFFKYWKIASPTYKRLIVGLIAFALFNSSDMLLLLKVNEATGSENNVLTVYIFYNFIYAVAAFPLGLLADHIGIKKIFLFGLILFSGIYFGMAEAGNNTLFYVLFGIYGIYMAATEGISKAWVASLVKNEEVGTAMGLFVALQSIALMVASAFAGLLWTFYGASVTFLLTAIMSILVFLFMLFFVPKTKNKMEHPQ
ncbi:arabinose efflux permease family protein [Galbibacter orientalis DSM 19592]|uniref:Arabinose efflux permease family protein n=1 Tax=Galbibacter orientalis DSM 19592 TaxID=926559 RepID=I3C6Q9_9FLAO|nr:MFS transporter [Galbibacter orientalis]EIJ39302.1 arabinose efflux permease family protein [Galbibacter orientalis DSM 19592]